MKFLAIDTGGKYLSVVAYSDGRAVKRFLPDCALRHSVILMDEIGSALREADLSPRDCDFFAAVVGPGSFTGIRIGISTVKGLCFSCGKDALAVTSFDCVAYDDKSGKTLALADAGRGEFYACGYTEGEVTFPPAILSPERVRELEKEGYALRSAQELSIPCALADPCEGLLRAVLEKRENAAAASGLRALYLRKSSAEENRK